MILLGLILIVLGAALGVVAYLAATSHSQLVELTALGWTRGFSPLELLVIGAAAVLLIWLGWALAGATLRRRSRVRREEREQERYAELERTHAEYRTEQETRFEEARLRDEDFARREEQIRTRQAEIELREEELSHRETQWRDRESPTVADVVTGRAEGQVSQGTAQWADADATRPVGQRVAETSTVEETRVADSRAGDERHVEQERVVEEQSPAPEPRRTDEA
jgi:membrane protein implicated in regulation of membrane protease activity